jgi:SAM-dependent methyltransferase
MKSLTHQALEYLNNTSFVNYLNTIKTNQPTLYALLNHSEFKEGMIDAYIDEMNSISWEFEDISVGGRGFAYNMAQKAASNREEGMISLLKCFSPSFDIIPGEDFCMLDVLGGDGTIIRFLNTLDGPKPTIFTADLSKYMISACYTQNMPCIRQSATKSLFRNSVLDGVLVAYGSHHLDHQARRLAAAEAHRTLKSGGRLVLHDFEIGEKSAKWFDEVVHPFSRTGHPHPHFSRQEMLEIFTTAGFRDIRIFDLTDSFTLKGDTQDNAKHNAIMHMYNMYDLVKIANSESDIVARVERNIIEIFGQIVIDKHDDEYIATIPRHALVAVGTKS